MTNLNTDTIKLVETAPVVLRWLWHCIYCRVLSALYRLIIWIIFLAGHRHSATEWCKQWLSVPFSKVCVYETEMDFEKATEAYKRNRTLWDTFTSHQFAYQHGFEKREKKLKPVENPHRNKNLMDHGALELLAGNTQSYVMDFYKFKSTREEAL